MLKRNRLIILVAISLIFSQSILAFNNKKTENNSKIENEIENCIDEFFAQKSVDFNILKRIFENYFSSSNISDINSPIEKQYLDILDFWEHPSKQFPLFADKDYLIEIRKKLGFSEKDIIQKKQLDCFTDKYIKYKCSIDTTSSIYAFGATFETLRSMPNIGPNIVAGAIKMTMQKADMKKTLYQKSIVLLFCFDMTLYLKDEND